MNEFSINFVISLFLCTLFIAIFGLYKNKFILFYLGSSIILSLIITEIYKNEIKIKESESESKSVLLHKQIDNSIFIGLLLGFSISFIYFCLSTESMYNRFFRCLILMCTITVITSYTKIIKLCTFKKKIKINTIK
jgi:hypothetical protein